MKKFIAGFTIVCLGIFPGFSQSPNDVYLWLKTKTIQQTIESRFPAPAGYKRVKLPPGSFGEWLRELPLLPKGTPVKDYRGRVKVPAGDSTLAGVVDYDISGKKLEQCMDIILRFRAEYLRSIGESGISFFLPVKFPLLWSDWARGLRPVFHGIDITLVQKEKPDSSRDAFDNYLKEIFYYSGTQTAYFNYPKIEAEKIQVGDFVVKKGKKGHAILILDFAVNAEGEKIALIGHGDTPACRFYLLNYRQGQPWFPLNPKEKTLPLPFEKKMYWEGLRRFSTSSGGN